MKNVFLGEAFVNNTLENIEIKNEMSSKFASRYIMRAMMAGVLVTFGYMLIMKMDANFNGSADPIGAMTGAALFSLVLAAIYYTKSELLTSNMMMVSVARYYKKISISKIIQILGLCYFGNLLGGILISTLVATSTTLSPDMLTSLEHSITVKQTYIADGYYWDLFVRGIFANFFINVAMLMIYSQNVKDDFGKIIVMFFGVFTFVILGFEHSIANTELFTLGFIYQLVNGVDVGFELSLALSNIVIVLIGNFIGGGILIGYYYAYINGKRDTKNK